jgi:hypothetical protein
MSASKTRPLLGLNESDLQAASAGAVTRSMAGNTAFARLKVPKTLVLKIPQSLLPRADEVIE